MEKEVPRYSPQEKQVLVKKYMKEFGMDKYEAELRVKLICDELTI